MVTLNKEHYYEILNITDETDISGLENIELNGKNIVELDDEIFSEFKNTKSLNLSSNKLFSFTSNTFFGLYNLENLDLSNNNITELNDQIFVHLNKLNKLEFSNNQIKSVSSNAFKGLKNLKSIYFKDNKIDSLSQIPFKDLVNLEVLHLAKNQIETISSEQLKNLLKLGKLYLNENKIKSLDKNLFDDLVNLEILNLSCNQIECISDNFINGVNLKQLFLSNSNIKSLDDNIFKNLVNLEALQLSKNKLERISENLFKGLTKLKDLCLDINKIKSIHDNAFYDLTSLDSLFMDKNELTSINSKIFINLKSLTVLLLSSNKIESVDEAAFQNLTKLELFDFNYNELKSIPSNLFAGLTELKRIDIASNKVEYIASKSFKDLINIISIDLYNNRLTSLDSEIFQGLIKLDSLNVSSNKLEFIDENIFKDLTSIREFIFDDNKIELLSPNQFKGLVCLENIDFSYNKIKLIKSKTFFDLPKLKEVNLNENKIDIIENLAFCNLENLETIKLVNNNIKFIHSGAFGNFNDYKQLKTIDIHGSDQIESIDLITFTNLNKLDKSYLNIIKSLKVKDIDFFPEGLDKINNELVDQLIKISYEMNYSKFLGIGLLLRVSIHKDDEDGTDINKQYLKYYFRIFPERSKFVGFTELMNFNNDEGNSKKFICEYIKEKLDTDVFHQTLMKGDSEIFPIFYDFGLIFEKDILINYLKNKNFKKFEEIIKRFLILSKQPIKSNSYYIILNCLFWMDNQTIFEYVLNTKINTEIYSQNYILDLLLSLNGLYLNSTNPDYLQLSPQIEANLKKNDFDIYRTLIYTHNLETKDKCLIYPIASLNSEKTLSFLLNDKSQVKLLTSTQNKMDLPLENIIMDKVNISNNVVKKIVDKYLTLSIEERIPFILSSKTIKCLAERNDSYLFKTMLDHTKIIDSNDLKQIDEFENFRECLKNSTNDCLKFAMDNENERIAEFLIDKLIELKINDYEKTIIDYETFARLFEIEWWTEIEKLLNTFCTEPYVYKDPQNNYSLSEKVIKKDEISEEESKYDNENSNSVIYMTEMDPQNNEEKENENDKNSEFVGFYKNVPQNDPDQIEKISQKSNSKDSYNFICLENDDDDLDIFLGNKEHFLMLIGRSCQAKLIKHKLVLRLVQLKWRYIPRIVYHLQTLLHFMFLIFFLHYILVEFEAYHQLKNDSNTIANNTEEFNSTLVGEGVKYEKPLTSYFSLAFTISLLTYFLIYEFFEGISEKFAYFLSIKNCLECLTYILSFIVVVIIKFETLNQITSLFGSIAILFGFIVLMLRLEKNSRFGSYVVAFRRAFSNTAKTLPFIVLLFAGFIFSFKIRSNNGVNYFAGSNFLDYISMAKMTNMIIGGYEINEMGLHNAGLTNEIANFFIYFTFLILMTIISVNLLTGIAIGELESVLKEAEIINIQQRIIYILHIQNILFKFQRRIERLFKIKKSNILLKLIKFQKEEPRKSTDNISKWKKIWSWIKKNSKPEIELIDKSEKDIEDYFIEAQYNARVDRDFISNKMNENEYKLTGITESLQSQRNEQMKRINEIDLTVSKNEKQLAELTEKLEINNHNISKTIAELVEKNEKKLVDITEILTKQMSELMIKMNEISNYQKK